ncbi:interferon-induced very large GTPase 1-like [Mytilus trossulus]|uniref:interferon-induced very large GTPase 1-like n=1 Tax=Mytilus trossulus TaxID=6551 RepID=UPI0030079E66
MEMGMCKDVVACVQKPSSLNQKDEIVDSDFEEDQGKNPLRQTAAKEIQMSDKTEEIERDGYGNTYNSEVTEEKSKLKDDMNQQTEESVSHNSDVKINKEEKKFADHEKTSTPTSKSVPQDSCSSMLHFLKRIGLERFYPNKLMLVDAMSIRAITTSFKLKDVALKFVENIVMMNCTFGGQMRSTSNIKTEMRKAIAGMMKQNIGESVYDRLPRCLIGTDEETALYKTAKLKALNVFRQIPYICLNVKATVVPLQGVTWASWSKKLKSVNKSSQYKSLPEQGTIRNEMNEERKKQLQICKNMGPFMKTLLDILSNMIQSDEDCTVFVLWLKQFLDQRSRSVLPGYLSQYQTDWQALKTNRDNKTEGDVIKKCKEDLERTEYKLAEASFGFEHLCREMGQIYESIYQCRSQDTINLKSLANMLPLITAKLLVMGQPFEIMDGDIANVPLCWVKAVLQQLRTILGEKKLLALSVLGIQSSGKSTLLNTMFGLQFAVSAGRCTRGVFIQLVPIDTANTKFDYILVIDTEGLRAPELANQKHTHDNELATFVIGLGDITIVNIKGENTAEMKDVLQIAVHAFLRLKLTNEKINLKQTCVFVHQNVPASDANDKMMQGRQKFVEVLDEMTREAAEQEKIADIQSFNQVIDFDSEKNVWYFSDLWHGDPPMAPANPGYSESVSKVKEAIIFRLTNGRETYLTIADTASRIDDLWNGILKDDFVFSFRNSLELKAYNSMDQKYQAIAWKLEKYVLEFIKSEAKSKLVSCVNKDALEIAVPAIMIQLTKEVDKQVEDLNHELDQFVAESILQDILIQWTQAKRNRLCNHAESLIMKAKTAVNNTKEELRIQKLRVSEKTKHEMEINNMAKELALQMKGQVPSIMVMEDKFNSLWNSWINNFTTKDFTDIVPIKDQIESLLIELFPSDATFKEDFIDKGLRLPDAKAYQNMKHLEQTLTEIYISTKKHLSIRKLYIFWREVSPDECKHQAIDFANRIFRKIDLKLEELNTDGIRFDPSYVTEILYIVSEEYSEFNQHTKNECKFNLLAPFRAMIMNHVVRYAISFFTRMNDSYNIKNSPKAQMGEYKGTAWALFKNTVEDATEDLIAFGFFRDAIVKAVVDQVYECLPIDAQESIQILFANRKYSLIKDILIHLATAEDFRKYKSFISDPYIYATRWIMKLLKRELFEEKAGTHSGCLYNQLARSRVTKIFSHISKCISDATKDCQGRSSSCMPKWIDSFILHNCKSPDLPLSNDTLIHVRDRKISNLDTFVVILNEQLSVMEDMVLDTFSNVNSDNVQWKKNPISEIMESLWGCTANCMFCHEPCMNSDKNHLEDKFPHKCLQHRPEGIGGCSWNTTNKLAVEFCNYSITTDAIYIRGNKEGPYKNYKEHYPDWDIPPNSDVSKYWMWVTCKFKDQLKEMYNTEAPDIPENWWLVQKEEAIQSL